MPDCFSFSSVPVRFPPWVPVLGAVLDGRLTHLDLLFPRLSLAPSTGSEDAEGPGDLPFRPGRLTHRARGWITGLGLLGRWVAFSLSFSLSPLPSSLSFLMVRCTPLRRLPALWLRWEILSAALSSSEEGWSGASSTRTPLLACSDCADCAEAGSALAASSELAPPKWAVESPLDAMALGAVDRSINQEATADNLLFMRYDRGFLVPRYALNQCGYLSSNVARACTD